MPPGQPDSERAHKGVLARHLPPRVSAAIALVLFAGLLAGVGAMVAAAAGTTNPRLAGGLADGAYCAATGMLAVAALLVVTEVRRRRPAPPIPPAATRRGAGARRLRGFWRRP